MTELRHQFEIFIRTTPEALWAAITRPEFTRLYFYGTAVESEFRKGSPLAYRSADGHDVVVGEVLEADPPRRLVTTWTFVAGCEGQGEADPPSRVAWEIEPGDDGVCRLRLVHDGFATETATYRSVGQGWMRVLSGLKTALETGGSMAA